ncbi:MAG: 3'-5' exonuclease [Trueperaceae bacterium]
MKEAAPPAAGGPSIQNSIAQDSAGHDPSAQEPSGHDPSTHECTVQLHSFEDRAAKARSAICELLERDDVLILDTETTGVGDAEVIELSLIDTSGTVLLDTLVRPRRSRMNPYAQRIHGISSEMLADQPSWPEVLPELELIAGSATLLAWNAQFDRQMLVNSSRAWELDPPRLLFVCAMRLYAQLHGRRGYGLHRAIGDRGMQHLFEQHASHRALGDVQLVLELLRACR